jgi:shikimate kinase
MASPPTPPSRPPSGAIVFLLGFMGAGKTTVGAALGESLGRPVVDLDARVEAAAGLSIVEIFARHGEAFFRQLEFQTLQEVSSRPAQVVCLGGGTYCRPEAVELVNRTGFSVWLDCPAEELARRCLGMHPPRPLARDAREFVALNQRRLEFYRQAHARVSTAGRPVAAVVAEIVEILRWKGMLGEAPTNGMQTEHRTSNIER